MMPRSTTADHRTNSPSFSGGNAGETHLGNQVSGQSQVRMQTSRGYRVIDQLVGTNAHEAKVGFQANAEFLRNQALSNR